jgi:hypothetical protein
MEFQSTSFLLGAGIGVILIFIFGLYLLFALLVYLLANLNLFFTQVDEGRAKAIKRNGRFIFAVMSYSGHTFRVDTPNPPTIQEEMWDVVPFPAGAHGRWYLPFLTNIRWIGFPPFSAVHIYRFKWTSLEQGQQDEHGLESLYKTSEKMIDYILVQDDVYVSQIPTVECSDKIPLNLSLVVGLRVTNVFKALFRVEQWLEASLNVINARMRDFVAARSYDEVIKIRRPGQAQPDDTDTALAVLDEFYRSVKDQIEKDWGVKVKFVRLDKVDPGSDLAAEFIRATTQLYVAQQKALADEAEGRGLAARDRQHFESIAELKGGVEMFKWQRIGESGLSTYVEGGGAIPAVSVGGQGGNPNRPNRDRRPNQNNQGGGNNPPAPPTPATT